MGHIAFEVERHFAFDAFSYFFHGSDSGGLILSRERGHVRLGEGHHFEIGPPPEMIWRSRKLEDEEE